jgi:hypothetical protein
VLEVRDIRLRPIREADLVDYLFGTKKKHRIHLVIVENGASRQVARKCGFTAKHRPPSVARP